MLNQTLCQVKEVHYIRPVLPCDRCGKPAPCLKLVERTALDLDLDGPILLLVKVSLHHCSSCHHYFRAQPPFLRPNCNYSRRVVEKASQAVYSDGLAFRQVVLATWPIR